MERIFDSPSPGILVRKTSSPSSTQIPLASSSLRGPHTIFSKQEFLSMQVKKRRETVHEFFPSELTLFFEKLREDAQTLKPCGREFVVIVPEMFDIDVFEGLLCSYFLDLGYQAVPSPRDISASTRSISLMIG